MTFAQRIIVRYSELTSNCQPELRKCFTIISNLYHGTIKLWPEQCLNAWKTFSVECQIGVRLVSDWCQIPVRFFL